MSLKYADLHTHTTYSDGAMTPTELVKLAAESGLSAIAISDHDSVDGVKEATAAGNKYGVEVIPAIELSVQSDTETHILGFCIDINNKALNDKLEEVKAVRRKRNFDMCSKLNELGFDMSLSEVQAIATGSLFGSTHFAALMLKKGYVSSMQEAFDKYLGFGKPAHSSMQCLSPEDGIRLIKAAGGGAFIAHPHLIGISDSELISLLCRLISVGLDGLEGYYTDYTPQMEAKYQRIANDLGLMISGGTDFHGINKPHIFLGTGLGNMRIPYSIAKKNMNKFN